MSFEDAHVFVEDEFLLSLNCSVDTVMTQIFDENNVFLIGYPRYKE